MQPQSGEGGVSSWALIVAACSLVLNAIMAIGASIWTLGRTHSATDEKIAEKERTATSELAALERRMQADIDNTIKNFGETMSAFRTKINDVELWNRDNFVSKLTFQTVVGDMKRSWERFEDKLSKRLDIIDEKLDQRNAE